MNVTEGPFPCKVCMLNFYNLKTFLIIHTIIFEYLDIYYDVPILLIGPEH